MLRLIKFLFKFAIVIAIGASLFAGLMFWAKFWSIYSVPPSKVNPDGATWIISRDEDDPFLDAPDRPKAKPAEEHVNEPPRLKGMYEGDPVPKKPPEKRIIFSLPYIELVHEKAIEKPKK